MLFVPKLLLFLFETIKKDRSEKPPEEHCFFFLICLSLNLSRCDLLIKQTFSQLDQIIKRICMNTLSSLPASILPAHFTQL